MSSAPTATSTVPTIRELPDRRSGGQLDYRRRSCDGRAIETLAADLISITLAGDLIIESSADRHTRRTS